MPYRLVRRLETQALTFDRLAAIRLPRNKDLRHPCNSLFEGGAARGQELHALRTEATVMAQAKIGVVGGGLGGLAAACVLAARGHAVTLFERSEWLGGKAAVLHEQGFRFDMG